MQIRLLMLLCLLGISAATAHRNDRGMDYAPYKDARGRPCCNSTDCRPADDFAETVVKGQPIIQLHIDGSWYNVPNYLVVAEDATDGRAHWCGKVIWTRDGESMPATACVILPPRGI